MIPSARPDGGFPGPDPGAPGPRPPRLAGPRPTAVLVLLVVVACWATGFVVNNLRGTTTFSHAVDTLFPRIGQGNSVDGDQVNAAWSVVRQSYWRTDVSGDQGTSAAIQGIIDDLHTRYNDRFSAYFTKQQFADLQNTLHGQHSGSIGIELDARCSGGAVCAPSANPILIDIVGVLKNQPAEKAGIRRGDVLTGVGGRPVTSFGADPVSQIAASHDIIDGPSGTQVTLTVRRGTQSLDVRVTRADLSIPAVYAQRFGAVVDIQITAFDADTGSAVAKQLGDALGAGATAVVLDLRANPGGYVEEAQRTASQFLTPSATEKDVSVRRGRITGGDPTSAQVVEHDAIISGGAAPTARLAVLVDGNTASAAEIVTAALRDYHRGRVVGEKTFGKGSVQNDFQLPDGSDLHLTIEKWFGPAGETIDGSGITPDQAVALPDEDHRFRLDAESVDASQDPQLQAGLAAVTLPA